MTPFAGHCPCCDIAIKREEELENKILNLDQFSGLLKQENDKLRGTLSEIQGYCVHASMYKAARVWITTTIKNALTVRALERAKTVKELLKDNADLVTENAKLRIFHGTVKQVIDRHGCSTPDCGLCFLKTKLGELWE